VKVYNLILFRLFMEIRPPENEGEFEKYYFLRWKVLRAPWNRPRGSEKDDKESDSIHLVAFYYRKIVGVGRAHLLDNKKGQIRYMAVREGFRGQGIGKKILKKLENKLKEKGVKKVILNARENALKFYEKAGYKIIKQGHTLFGSVKHFKMEKLME